MPTVSLTRLSDAHSGSARPTPTDDLNGPANAVRAPRDLAGGERGEEGDSTFRHGLSAVLATAAPPPTGKKTKSPAKLPA